MNIKLFAGKGCLVKGLLGVVLFVTGLIILLMDPVAYIVKKTLEMSRGSLVERLWMDVPVEINNYMYVFNITNSEEFLSGKDKKLKFEELGPYTFKEVRGNVNITYHDNGTVTYTPTLSVPFVPELSAGNIFNDTLVTINIPLLGVLSLYSDASSFKKFGLNLMVNSFAPSPFVKLSVQDFFWGYEDKMVELLATYMPGWIDFEKFGVLDRVYAYKKDEITVNLDDSKGDRYSIQSWNGSPGLKNWGYTDFNTSLPCNRLTGSFEGLIYPPGFRPKNKTFRVYKKYFCRPLSVNFEETVEDVSGLLGDSYVISPDELSCKNPENSCYCTDDRKCLPDGVADMSPCYYGIPLSLSNPHFLEGDPKLLEPFEGLNPQKEKHGTTYILQPDVGLPIRASVKAQINLVVKDVKYNRYSKLFTDTVIPFMWLDSRMDGLPTGLMLLIKMCFLYLPIAQMILGWALLVLGIAMFFYNTMVLLKPTQDWVVRKASVSYPGRLPMVATVDRRRWNDEEETRMFI